MTQNVSEPTNIHLRRMQYINWHSNLQVKRSSYCVQIPTEQNERYKTWEDPKW